jgi:hypothetical protein
MGRLDLHGHRLADGVMQIAVEVLEVLVGMRRLDGDLAQTILGPAIDRDPRAVGAAVGHGDEHVRQHGAELRFQLRVLQKKSNDATHGFVSFT